MMTDPETCRPGGRCGGIAIRSLSVWYGQTRALRSVTLRIQPCEITAVIGPSGCGKSTFLATLNRMTDLYNSCRVEGQILLDGHDIHETNMDPIALRRRVGMIFQRPNPFPFSIASNLDFPLREHGIRDRAERAAIIRRSLERVGLWPEVKDRLDTSALTLSGGQQQRLCIARAIALEPEVLLFDEPCSALDPISSGVVEDLIVNLRGAYTVVVVTHNLAQARRISDHSAVFWMHDGAGELIESGTREQVFEAPEHELTRAYINGHRG